jgi:hypothetical protein
MTKKDAVAMKKEYLILTMLILCLSAYLFFHNENQDHYQLPDLKKVNAKAISSIKIDRKGESMILKKKGDSWLVSENGFPADTSMVDVLLDTLRTFELTTLISQKSDLMRYQLDADNRIHVTVFQKEKPFFEFSIGKPAPTGNHTFVMVEGDKNIYHAKGSFTLDFDQEEAAFRDKKIFEVKPDAVTKVTVKKGRFAKTIEAVKKENDNGKIETRWQTESGKPFDKKQVDSFLASVSYLKCDTYQDEPSKTDLENQKPMGTITIDAKNAKKSLSLKLYQTEDGTRTYGTSSMNDYAFAFNRFDINKITKSMDAFLGIPKTDK